jgi:plasmid stability protein
MLQIKNLPDEVHAELRLRAQRDGTTMSALAARILTAAMSRPSIDDWLARFADRHGPTVTSDPLDALDGVRSDLAP